MREVKDQPSAHIGSYLHLADIPVIVGTRIELRSASITYMIRHYAAEGGDLVFDHRHNAADRVCPDRRGAGTAFVVRAARARGLGA